MTAMSSERIMQKARDNRGPSQATEAGSEAQTVNDDPQPQPPEAFGFSKANPDSWKLLL